MILATPTLHNSLLMPLHTFPQHYNSVSPHKTPEILAPHKLLDEVKEWGEAAVEEDVAEGVDVDVAGAITYILDLIRQINGKNYPLRTRKESLIVVKDLPPPQEQTVLKLDSPWQLGTYLVSL
jgi:hypothetical protein